MPVLFDLPVAPPAPSDPPAPPVIRVESGNPTPEELAAVTALLLARAHRPAGQDAPVVSLASWRRKHVPTSFEAPSSWRCVS